MRDPRPKGPAAPAALVAEGRLEPEPEEDATEDVEERPDMERSPDELMPESIDGVVAAAALVDDDEEALVASAKGKRGKGERERKGRRGEQKIVVNVGFK
jgi:hypothetical protein